MIYPLFNIALYGFMGSGKSTLGAMLAKRLSRKHVDLDDYIEKSYNIDIAMFFEDFGEESFREMEKKALQEVMSTYTIPHVLSLGGGSLLDLESAALVQRDYRVYTLDVPLSVLAKRISKSDRPLKTQVRALYEERKNHYQQIGCRIVLDDVPQESALESLCEVLDAA